MRTALASILVGAALVLGACGSGSTTTTGGASTGTSTSATSATSTTASTANTTTSTSSSDGTGTSSTGSATTASNGNALIARHSQFRTTTPSGFISKPATEANVELRVSRANAGGHITVLTVFRGVAHEDLHALAARALGNLASFPTFLPKPQKISALQSTQVDGQPALYFDYRFPGRKPIERRQVFVIDGEWKYEISDSAAPAQFAASLTALQELISSWRWQ
jgi:hypothetical protein